MFSTKENKRKNNEEICSEDAHIDKKSKKDPLLILNELLERADNLVSQKKHDEAMEVYTKIINLDPKEYVQSELNPRLAEAYLKRGRIYLDRNQLEEAKINFSQSIGICPNYDAYSDRAIIHFNQKNYDSSIEDDSQAIKLGNSENKLFKSHYNRGLTYEMKNQIAEAIDDYTQAISLKAHDADSYFNRGEMYVKLQKYDLAIDDLTLAHDFAVEESECKPKSAATLANAYFFRGEEYKMKIKLHKAIDDFKTACNLYNKKTYENKLGETESLLVLLQEAANEKDKNQRETLIKTNSPHSINFLTCLSGKLNALINYDLNFHQAQRYLKLAKYSDWILQGKQLIEKYSIHNDIFFYITSFLIKTSCRDAEIIADRLFKRIYSSETKESISKYSSRFFIFNVSYVREKTDNNVNCKETEKVLNP